MGRQYGAVATTCSTSLVEPRTSLFFLSVGLSTQMGSGAATTIDSPFLRLMRVGSRRNFEVFFLSGSKVALPVPCPRRRNWRKIGGSWGEGGKSIKYIVVGVLLQTCSTDDECLGSG